MTSSPTPPSSSDRRRRRTVPRGSAAALALGAAGVVAGAVLASTLSATAATTPPSPTPAAPSGTTDGARPGHPAETVVTDAATVASIKSSVLAKYPGATIQRYETDSTGAYEAHVTTAAGKQLHVELSKTFAITGERAGRGPGGPGGRHGHSSTDPAHEAAESPAHAAEEKAQDDSTSGTTTG